MLTLAAFCLRLYRLDAPSLRGDEAFSILFARNTPGDMLREFGSLTEPHPPLSFFVLHYWGKLAGESEFALRFTSVWMGTLAVPLIYVLGRLLATDLWGGRSVRYTSSSSGLTAGGSAWSQRVGLVAAGLLTVNPFYIWHAQEARMYALSATLCLASTVLCIVMLKRPARRWWVAYGVVTALSVYAHYYAFLVVVFQGLCAVLYCVFYRDRAVGWGEHLGPLVRWLAGLVLAGLLYSPWLLPTWRVLTAYRGNARSDLPFVAPVYRSLLVFGQGQTLPKKLSLWFLPLWGGLFLSGIAVAWRRSWRNAVLTILYLLVPWIAIFVDSLRRPAFDERYFMVSTPPYYLLIASALAALLSRGRRARTSHHTYGRFALAMALVIGICGISLYHYYHDPAYARAPDWRSLNEYLCEHSRNGDIVILNYPDPAARYYYSFAQPWVILPESYPVDRLATINSLERIAETYSRVWLTPQQWEFWDDEGLVEQWLDGHTERVFGTNIDKFRLSLYHTSRQFVEEMASVDANLRRAIRLVGYVVRDERGNAVDRIEVRPGQSVRLTLYWQAVSGIDMDYVVFAHLLDSTGWLRGQRDNQPRWGTLPTKAWKPGEWVVDPYDIPLAADAPPGEYTIEVGMYHPGDGTRLPITGNDADSVQRRVLLHNRVYVR